MRQSATKVVPVVMKMREARMECQQVTPECSLRAPEATIRSLPQMKELYTPPSSSLLGQLAKPDEAAKVFRLHVVTLRRLAKSGRIPSIRLGPRLLRFDLAAVRAALANFR